MSQVLLSLAAVGLTAGADVNIAGEACNVGTGKCSDGLRVSGDVGTGSRFSAIASNDKGDIAAYGKRFQNNDTLEERQTTDQYYDLATDFYEYGWGSSFHFATRFQGETLAQSITRHEYFLAGKLDLKPGMKAGDLGMGIGGPLRSITKFSGADVTGVSINDYQVRRAKAVTEQRESAQAAKRMHYVHGDFTKLVPQVFEPESLDAIFYIESSCHISNRTEIFREGAKALKKGGKIFLYEWVMTNRFDRNNETHMKIKKDIEYGNGIEDMIVQTEVIKALENSGFRILEEEDLQDSAEELFGEHNVPWYYDMSREYAFGSLESFKLSQFGQRSLSGVLTFMEMIKLVPPGASDTNEMLKTGGKGLVKGGQLKIFTPMYMVLGEKL